MDAKVTSLSTFLQPWINWAQDLNRSGATFGKQHTCSREDVFDNFQYIPHIYFQQNYSFNVF
jgi:hypothetical protein